MSEFDPEDVVGAAAGRARELLEPPIIYLPIRHHSPACAEHVRTVIANAKPSHVLVEGSPLFNDQIDLLLHPEAKMPLAIYSYAAFTDRDGDTTVEDGELARHGSYFPLCDYSPELVALRAGREVGAELGFVDLDYAYMGAFDHFALGHSDETKMLFSEVLSRAAAELGARDHNELWDQLVEAVDQTTEEHVAAVLTYGQLARVGATPDYLDARGTLAREEAMATLISEAVHASKGSPVVVVTGAFHTVALPELVDRLLGGEALRFREFAPAAESGHGLIRYSFDRLDSLAGYGAGMANPRWYQLEWERRTGGDPPAFTVVNEVARAIRAATGDAQPSLPTVIDANAAVEQLHSLRGRTVPSRLDVIDAMVSCFVKGEDTPFGAVRMESRRAMTGFATGAVPPGTPRVPLAKDFDRMARELGFTTESAEPKQVNLDVYRSERDRKKSRFLHGLSSLDVRFGSCISPLRFTRSGGRRDLVRERWTVQLDGATDVSLTEASMWGSRVSEAVEAKTLHELQEVLETQPSSAEILSFVRRAAERGVHAVVGRAIDIMRSRIGVDPSLVDVIAAMTEAELLWVGREPLGGSLFDTMPEVATQLYVRSCQLIGRAHDAPEDEWDKLVGALGALHGMLLTDSWPGLDHSLFWSAVERERDLVPSGMLQGSIVGLEWRGGVHDDETLRSFIKGHLGSGASIATGVSFLQGVIMVARDALWEIEGLVAVLSDVLERPDARSFLSHVAHFRAAFSALTPAETDRVAEMVMAHLGEAINIRVSNISEGEVLRNAALSIDLDEALRSDGLGSWLSPIEGAP